MTPKYTLEDVKAMDKETIPLTVVADVIGGTYMSLLLTAREHPERLGFPVIVYARRVKVPRKAFIRFMEG